jgi:hypothetical protein
LGPSNDRSLVKLGSWIAAQQVQVQPAMMNQPATARLSSSRIELFTSQGMTEVMSWEETPSAACLTHIHMFTADEPAALQPLSPQWYTSLRVWLVFAVVGR